MMANRFGLAGKHKSRRPQRRSATQYFIGDFDGKHLHLIIIMLNGSITGLIIMQALLSAIQVKEKYF
jgi:hypothetical protein